VLFCLYEPFCVTIKFIDRIPPTLKRTMSVDSTDKIKGLMAGSLVTNVRVRNQVPTRSKSRFVRSESPMSSSDELVENAGSSSPSAVFISDDDYTGIYGPRGQSHSHQSLSSSVRDYLRSRSTTPSPSPTSAAIGASNHFEFPLSASTTTSTVSSAESSLPMVCPSSAAVSEQSSDDQVRGISISEHEFSESIASVARNSPSSDQGALDATTAPRYPTPTALSSPSESRSSFPLSQQKQPLNDGDFYMEDTSRSLFPELLEQQTQHTGYAASNLGTRSLSGVYLPELEYSSFSITHANIPLATLPAAPPSIPVRLFDRVVTEASKMGASKLPLQHGQRAVTIAEVNPVNHGPLESLSAATHESENIPMAGNISGPESDDYDGCNLWFSALPLQTAKTLHDCIVKQMCIPSPIDCAIGLAKKVSIAFNKTAADRSSKKASKKTATLLNFQLTKKILSELEAVTSHLSRVAQVADRISVACVVQIAFICQIYLVQDPVSATLQASSIVTPLIEKPISSLRICRASVWQQQQQKDLLQGFKDTAAGTGNSSLSPANVYRDLCTALESQVGKFSVSGEAVASIITLLKEAFDISDSDQDMESVLSSPAGNPVSDAGKSFNPMSVEVVTDLEVVPNGPTTTESAASADTPKVGNTLISAKPRKNLVRTGLGQTGSAAISAAIAGNTGSSSAPSLPTISIQIQQPPVSGASGIIKCSDDDKKSSVATVKHVRPPSDPMMSTPSKRTKQSHSQKSASGANMILDTPISAYAAGGVILDTPVAVHAAASSKTVYNIDKSSSHAANMPKEPVKRVLF
jgi:hypothetical protein